MCFISTSIDLNRGLMFVESPRCRVKLQINLRIDSYTDTKEEIELHAKRFASECTFMLCLHYMFILELNNLG